VILRRARLALSNDTGPGHLAGALGIPTITPFLPGAVYSRQVWASTLWHRGVTIEPSSYQRNPLSVPIFSNGGESRVAARRQEYSPLDFLVSYKAQLGYENV
jgi:glycosyl transferase family 9 (putative heptosyltransferase)